MKPERARRRLRRWLLLGVAGLLIAAATIVGGFSLMFPWLLAHPERVQQFLSDRLHRPVSFAGLQGEWLPEGPVFRIDGLRIGGDGGQPALELRRAEIVIDFYAPFKRDVSWHELRIVGLEVDAERDADGRFHIVQWRGSNDAVGDPLDALRSLGAFRIIGSRLRFHDQISGSRIALTDINVAVGQRVGGQRVIGRVQFAEGASMGVRCELNGDFRAGRCYTHAQKLPVAPSLSEVQFGGIALVGGNTDLQLWLQFTNSRLTTARLELNADALSLRGMRPVLLGNDVEVEPRYSPDRTQLAIDWQRREGGDTVAILEGTDLDADDSARSKLVFTRDVATASWQLSIEQLVLERLMPWFSLSRHLSPAAAGWIYESAPSGQIRDLRVIGHGGDVDAIDGQLRALALHSTRRSPHIDGINATLRGDAQAVSVKVAPVDTVVDFPGVFRAPLPLRLERADVVISRIDDGLLVELPGLAVQGKGFGIDGQLALKFVRDGKRPEIDAVITVRDSNVVSAQAFWPANVMPKASVNWLDRALVAGRILRGRASIRGDLDDWPFRNDEGRFMADAEVEELVLDYHRDWPRGTVAYTDVRFLNGGMSAQSRDVRLINVAMPTVSGSLESFKDPILRLRGSGQGSGPALLEFLRATPLNQRYRDQLHALTIGGTGDVAVDLTLPLAARLGVPVLDGHVDLHQADLADAKWGLEFAQADGRIAFSREGFAAEALDVLVDGDPAKFSIAIGAFARDPANQVEAGLRGTMQASAALSAFHAFDPYWQRMPGKAHWDLALTVPRVVTGNEDAVTRSLLTVKSDLRGIALELPAPFGKDAESPLPLAMRIDLPAAGNVLDMQLGEIARFKARIADDTRAFAGHLALGGELAEVPGHEGLRITGAAPAIDLAGWSTFGAGNDDAPLDLSVNVRASELDLLGRPFVDAGVRIERDANTTHVELLGTGINGSFDIPRADLGTRGLTLQFEKLHWPEAPSGSSTPGRSTTRASDPSQLPPLHIWVRDLKLGAASFGEARIETQPMPSGLRIEQFDARSPTLTLRASGDWQVQQGIERSSLDITMSSESLGQMLASLGFSGVIEGGQTVAHVKGSWLGSPAQFGLDRITGELSGEVGQGRILNVEPGAGRIFGLVNFSAIPRRLSLDFRDFFQSGMAFDSIKGSFTLADGSAHTDDLQIKGPAADIRISGRTGLRARDYEQEMEVTPKLRGALPIVGAVAGGPVGAMVGVLAQEMMRKPIDGIASKRYRVRGTWEKPDITVITRSGVTTDGGSG